MTITACPQTETVRAWHFLPKNRRLANGDGRLVRVGETLSVDCKPELYESGMHGSVQAIDALRYAKGPVACRVDIWGDIHKGDDELAGAHRFCIAIADASELLHEFACWCAENALTQWEKRNNQKAHPRSWGAIKTKRLWLKGEATNEELAAAREAAWAGARAASRISVWAAAREAAREAAWDAARNTAEEAAWNAAGEAALVEEIEHQNNELESGLREILGLQEDTP